MIVLILSKRGFPLTESAFCKSWGSSQFLQPYCKYPYPAKTSSLVFYSGKSVFRFEIEFLIEWIILYFRSTLSDELLRQTCHGWKIYRLYIIQRAHRSPILIRWQNITLISLPSQTWDLWVWGLNPDTSVNISKKRLKRRFLSVSGPGLGNLPPNHGTFGLWVLILSPLTLIVKLGSSGNPAFCGSLETDDAWLVNWCAKNTQIFTLR